MDNTQYTRHPVSAAYGDMSEEEKSILSGSILLQGYDGNEPVVSLPDNQIIDGWHRYQVCLEIGISPVFETRDMKPLQIYEYTRAKHQGRRNKTPSERAESDVLAKRACGMEFAPRGRPRKAAPEDAEDVEPTQYIKAEDVAKDAQVSIGTAQQAVANVKHQESGDSAPRQKEQRRKPASTEQPSREQARAERAMRSEMEEMRDQIDSLERSLDQERATNETLKERIAIIETSADPDEQKRLEDIKLREDLIVTLESQIAEWQTKHADVSRDLRKAKSQVTKLQNHIAKLEKTLEDLNAVDASVVGEDINEAF